MLFPSGIGPAEGDARAMPGKHWGPFSGRQLTTIICIIGGLALFPIGAAAVVTGSNTFVTDASTGKHVRVDASGALRTWALPANWFTLGPQAGAIAPSGSPNVLPSPSGTRFAISSFTVTNGSGTALTFSLNAYAMSGTLPHCGNLSNVLVIADGPVVTVGANSTVSLTYPTPFITSRISGTSVCLAAGGSGNAGLTWAATGYALLP
jgi:hypothetical protein